MGSRSSLPPGEPRRDRRARRPRQGKQASRVHPPLPRTGLTAARLQAVESLNKICNELSPAQVEEYFIPLTLRLSKAEWFTSKVSGCGLFTAPYSKVSAATQEELRKTFSQLVHDETPMVRRQAATNMAKFVKEMTADVAVDDMMPLFQHLAQDDQDSVRLLTVEILISIAEVVPKEQQSSHGVLLALLRALIEDKSWRVRYMIADRFEKVIHTSSTITIPSVSAC